MKKVITEEIFKIYPQKRTESFSEATHFSFETPTIIQIKPSIEADNDSSDNVPAKPVIDWNLNEIKRKIAIFTNEGKLSHELVDTIFKNGLCAPIEFDLLDYKQDIESSKPDLAKLILRIISLNRPRCSRHF